MASISKGDASTVTLSRAENKAAVKDWWLLYIVYVCVNACEWERGSKRRRITSDLCSDDHSLCGCTPALLGLGWNPKNVSRFWEQSAGRELCGICAHFHRGELIWISAIQPVCYLIPWKTDNDMKTDRWYEGFVWHTWKKCCRVYKGRLKKKQNN